MSTYVIVVYSARSGTSSKVYLKLENICKKHTNHLRQHWFIFLMSEDGIITTKSPFIFFLCRWNIPCWTEIKNRIMKRRLVFYCSVSFFDSSYYITAFITFSFCFPWQQALSPKKHKAYILIKPCHNL